MDEKGLSAPRCGNFLFLPHPSCTFSATYHVLCMAFLWILIHHLEYVPFNNHFTGYRQFQKLILQAMLCPSKHQSNSAFLFVLLLNSVIALIEYELYLPSIWHCCIRSSFSFLTSKLQDIFGELLITAEEFSCLYIPIWQHWTINNLVYSLYQ